MIGRELDDLGYYCKTRQPYTSHPFDGLVLQRQLDAQNRNQRRHIRDHAPVRLPGVNVGHSNFRYVSFKKNHII